MAKSTEWHETLVAVLERRARLVGEIRRSRTLSAEARKVALAAVDRECFEAARRVFPAAPVAYIGSPSQVVTTGTQSLPLNPGWAARGGPQA